LDDSDPKPEKNMFRRTEGSEEGQREQPMPALAVYQSRTSKRGTISNPATEESVSGKDPIYVPLTTSTNVGANSSATPHVKPTSSLSRNMISNPAIDDSLSGKNPEEKLPNTPPPVISDITDPRIDESLSGKNAIIETKQVTSSSNTSWILALTPALAHFPVTSGIEVTPKLIDTFRSQSPLSYEMILDRLTSVVLEKCEEMNKEIERGNDPTHEKERKVNKSMKLLESITSISSAHAFSSATSSKGPKSTRSSSGSSWE
jgi:hypothetical protein